MEVLEHCQCPVQLFATVFVVAIQQHLPVVVEENLSFDSTVLTPVVVELHLVLVVVDRFDYENKDPKTINI